MSIIKGHLGAIYIATGTAQTLTDDATTANVAATEFVISDSDHRFLDPATAVVVEYNGSAVTTYATLQRPGGKVTWDTTPGAEAVTLSGAYIPVTELGEARGWTLDTQWEFVDVSTFGDTFRVNEPTFRGATVSIEHFYVDSSMFTIMSGGTVVGFDLFMDATASSELRYTGFAYMSSQSISAPVDGIIDEPLSLTVIDGPYYMAGL